MAEQIEQPRGYGPGATPATLRNAVVEALKFMAICDRIYNVPVWLKELLEAALVADDQRQNDELATHTIWAQVSACENCGNNSNEVPSPLACNKCYRPHTLLNDSSAPSQWIPKPLPNCGACAHIGATQSDITTNDQCFTCDGGKNFTPKAASAPNCATCDNCGNRRNTHPSPVACNTCTKSSADTMPSNWTPGSAPAPVTCHTCPICALNGEGGCNETCPREGGQLKRLEANVVCPALTADDGNACSQRGDACPPGGGTNEERNLTCPCALHEYISTRDLAHGMLVALAQREAISEAHIEDREEYRERFVRNMADIFRDLVKLARCHRPM